MASYREGLSTYARATIVARSGLELAEPLSVDASELRARAARYRQLAEVLFDPRVVAEVEECARELDTEAAWIERQNAFGARLMMQRYGIGG